MSGALASQAFEKLAFIHVFRYSVVDFGGVDWPLQINLTDISSSPSGGENPANRGLSEGHSISLTDRISLRFGGAARAVGATMMAGAMIAVPMSAMANDAPKAEVTANTPAPTVSVIDQQEAVPSVPMSDRMEISERGARLVAATGSKDGIVFLVYGKNQWLIDELSFAISDGHQKGRAVKGIALGSSTAPDGFDVYVNGLLIAEARDVLNTDVRGGATYAIEYGQNILETRFKSTPDVQTTASLER